MRNIHLNSPTPPKFCQNALRDLPLLQSRLCFTEYSSCWMLLAWILWQPETDESQGGDFLPLPSHPPNTHTHACTIHTHTDITYMCLTSVLTGFLYRHVASSIGFMQNLFKGTCSFLLYLVLQKFRARWAPTKASLPLQLTFSIFLKGSSSRGTISIFLCSSFTETKVACQTDGKI